MTEYEKIISFNLQQMAEFIESICYGSYEPWAAWFKAKYCDSCPTVHVTHEMGEDDLNECDFADGVCPHGSSVEHWLNEKAKIS